MDGLIYAFLIGAAIGALIAALIPEKKSKDRSMFGAMTPYPKPEKDRQEKHHGYNSPPKEKKNPGKPTPTPPKKPTPPSGRIQNW